MKSYLLAGMAALAIASAAPAYADVDTDVYPDLDNVSAISAAANPVYGDQRSPAATVPDELYDNSCGRAAPEPALNPCAGSDIIPRPIH